MKACRSTKPPNDEYEACADRRMATSGAVEATARRAGGWGVLERERFSAQPPCLSTLIALNLVCDLTLPAA